ncbi:MAG: hypothetical protein JWR19_1515 [Pedosphaera sp.]|nr:hypothetical protein [Pedosphaera sp.]
MNALTSDARGSHLGLDSQVFQQSFDREPFGITHDLHTLDMFQFDSLRALANVYSRNPQDCYVGTSAASAGSKFYAPNHVGLDPAETMDKLDTGAYRILLKRLERHDKRFRKLLDDLFHQVIEQRGGLKGERLVRLESSVFISSAASTTPFHFDPEIQFFHQIFGDKIYHVYSPATVSEPELERFYLRGVVDIGQVDLKGRDPKRESVFALSPGKGLHQPQNAPHWVETKATRSISFSFVFETDATRSVGRARSFNHYMRKFGIKPAQLGTHPDLDAFKSGTMRVVIPARQVLGKAVRKALRKP